MGGLRFVCNESRRLWLVQAAQEQGLLFWGKGRRGQVQVEGEGRGGAERTCMRLHVWACMHAEG